MSADTTFFLMIVILVCAARALVRNPQVGRGLLSFVGMLFRAK